MNSNPVISQIQSLELQLAVLRAQLKQSSMAAPLKTAADLHGICAGLSETTEEDLEAVKYRPKWEASSENAGPSS